MKQFGLYVRLCTAVWILFVAPLAYAQSLPASAVQVLYHFPAPGGAIPVPVGQLAQGTDGTLYGVLYAGGTFAQGSVFKFDTQGQFQTLYSFGTSSTQAVPPDGAFPNGGLVFGPDGNLYGTTTQGGTNLGGTAFKMTVTGEITTLVAFNGSGTAGGWQPHAPVSSGADGNFYGTTNLGGTGNVGTVFRMTPSGTVTILHSFAADGSEGEDLFAPVLRVADGTLYGTTSLGGGDPISGPFGDGTVFKIAPDGTFSVLHYFPYTATNLVYGLVAGADGTLYGTTEISEFTSGEVFSITPAGTYTTLHGFGCSCGTPEGSQPIGPLTLGSDGNFYGVTSYGGTANSGTIFSVAPNGTITPLHSFVTADGGAPGGGLIQGIDGRFYGMTSGAFTRDPTIYSFALPPSTSPTTISATAANGAVTLSWGSVQGANGYDVYQGTTPGGESSTPILTGLTNTSATITALQNGTTYYFNIVAENEAGNGPASAEVSALPIAAPGSLTATAGNATISLSWSAAAGALSYSVYEGTSSGAESTNRIATGLTATSFTVVGLTNGTTYFFKIAAVNGPTTVNSTAEASATPKAPAGGGGAIDGSLLVLLGLFAIRSIGRPS